MDKYVTNTVDKAKAAAAGGATEGESRKLAEEIQRLRDELEGIKKMQSEASKLSESVEKVVKERMERAEGAEKGSKRGAPRYT
jgi:t-SNARE complex subunit (syntaxin)